jgi:putative transposase
MIDTISYLVGQYWLYGLFLLVALIIGILNKLGIFRFDQIAAWNKKTIAWVNEHLLFKGSIDREGQIIRILQEQESGMTTVEICRKHGIGESTFYKWKSKYGGMGEYTARRLKTLEDENHRLKNLLADAHLDISMLKSTDAKK